MEKWETRDGWTAVAQHGISSVFGKFRFPNTERYRKIFGARGLPIESFGGIDFPTLRRKFGDSAQAALLLFDVPVVSNLESPVEDWFDEMATGLRRRREVGQKLPPVLPVACIDPVWSYTKKRDNDGKLCPFNHNPEGPSIAMRMIRERNIPVIFAEQDNFETAINSALDSFLASSYSK